MSMPRQRWVVSVSAIAVIGLTVAAHQARQTMIDTRPALPLTFAHLDHHEVNCITCHHNFADTTGQGLCIDCHKMNLQIRSRIEPMFHTLCRNCHVEKHRAGKDAGPARRCSDCHTADDAP